MREKIEPCYDRRKAEAEKHYTTLLKVDWKLAFNRNQDLVPRNPVKKVKFLNGAKPCVRA